MVDLSTRPLSGSNPGGSSAFWRPGQDGPSARNSAGGSAFAETEYWDEGERPWWKTRLAIIGAAVLGVLALAVALGVGLGVGVSFFLRLPIPLSCPGGHGKVVEGLDG